MKLIRSKEELAQILLSNKGFVLNRRPESRKLHHASCDAIGIMNAREYPKYYAEDRAEARHWLDEKFGIVWKNCGHCGGLNSIAQAGSVISFSFNFNLI